MVPPDDDRARLRFDEMCAAGEAAWPTVRIDRETFRAYVNKRESAGSESSEEEEQDAEELWICAALNARHPAAASAFDKRYFALLPAALKKLRLADHELDELTQLLRTKLLVPNASADGEGGGGQLLIERYAGQGKLAGFIKVTATRDAISRFRKKTPGDAQANAFDPEMIFLPANSTDPAIAAIKGRTREAFREGLAIAFQSLEPRERNLLRLHLLGGVTLERLATMHGAHRATIVRWLRDARERVLERTRTELRERLGVRADEVDSLMGLATSHLDLTLDRLLKTEGAGAEEADTPTLSKGKLQRPS